LTGGKARCTGRKVLVPVLSQKDSKGGIILGMKGELGKWASAIEKGAGAPKEEGTRAFYPGRFPQLGRAARRAATHSNRRERQDQRGPSCLPPYPIGTRPAVKGGGGEPEVPAPPIGILISQLQDHFQGKKRCTLNKAALRARLVMRRGLGVSDHKSARVSKVLLPYLAKNERRKSSDARSARSPKNYGLLFIVI